MAKGSMRITGNMIKSITEITGTMVDNMSITSLRRAPTV
jgi:hypothetical protein